MSSLVKYTDLTPLKVKIEDRSPLSELPDKLWDRILGFATHVHDPDYLQIDEEIFNRTLHLWPPVNSIRKKVLLLSRRFYVCNPLLDAPSHLTLRHSHSASGSDTCIAFLSYGPTTQ